MSNTFQREPESSLDPVHADGTYILPTTTYDTLQWQSDAQIAARKAMAKRSSRSYAARVSRAKSRKKERPTRPMKPTVDTSFTIHRGNVPRQIHPQENDTKNSGSLRKHTFLGLGRSGTKTKGLGIMKGTPQPENQEQLNQSSQEPKTASSLVTVSPLWTGISPSDRPIPIGISIPTDSLPDFSPYQSTRHRSTSDAVTPSIIITPAAAFKSVWSPDTESEYTPSVYSRATLNYVPLDSAVPPVPALPVDISKSTMEREKDAHDQNKQAATRARHDTLDSAGTAFEEYDYEIKRSDRIMSTATVFEEDELPLRSKGMQSGGLTIDTTGTVPTPRRSQGWWNFITTPFELSRTNSVWTQNTQNQERVPDIPMIPRRFDKSEDSPSTPSTYIWSATEKSPSVAGDIIVATLLPTAATKGNVRQAGETTENSNTSTLVATSSEFGGSEKPRDQSSKPASQAHAEQQELPRSNSTKDRTIASPLSATSASPVLGAAAIGTVLLPRQVHEQQPQQQQINVNVNIELQDRRLAANAPMKNANQPANATASTHSADISSPPPVLLHGGVPAAIPQNVPQFPPPTLEPLPASTLGSQDSPAKSTGPRDAPSQTSQPHFPPPPHFAHYNSTQKGYRHNSRSSSPVSDGGVKKLQKKPRKVFALMDRLRFGRRTNNAKKHDKNRNKKRRRVWCWGCCCCLLILILLAIIIPVVIVVGRKQNNAPQDTGNELGSQWLNLTGYPPIPTGVSAVHQPNPVVEQAGCAAPATVWSCAIPKEQQKPDSGIKPNQPNMTFEITFVNGTAIDASKLRPARRAANAAGAGAFVRSLLGVRDVAPASPAPPALEDYNFLGNTTDRNQVPFEGEETPFMVSLQTTQTSTAPGLAKRADDTLTNITQSIPGPLVNSDGTAAAANLLPTASNQPLRLFNRGKEDEYYGFFVYYDRSIFLKNIDRNFSNGGNPADLDGGSPFSAATLRVTWAQSRFLVQIWTRSQKSKQLLRPGNATPDTTKGLGAFTYPVTVTIDRHGSRADKKMIYWYEMEKDGTIAHKAKNKGFIFEDRKFGGTSVNPAGGVDRDVKGPIDGGTGGCSCKWQNWA